MRNMTVCPIWGTEATTYPVEGSDSLSSDSPRADGYYIISGSARAVIQGRDKAFKARLTTWLIDQRRLGTQYPEISTNTLKEIQQQPALPIPARMQRLLEHIDANVPSIGGAVKISASETNNAALAITESQDMSEVAYLLNALEHKKRIEKLTLGYGITVDGYGYLTEIRTQTVVSQQAFVAMWFDASMDGLYEQAIKPAISRAGYKPLRVDSVDHNNKIDDQIVAEIKRSRFIIADFTHGRPEGVRGGVYYEAGFAHGMNIPVIFTCRKNMIQNVHFDTRQYNHILWEETKLDDFCTELSNKISATIGDGPLKNGHFKHDPIHI